MVSFGNCQSLQILTCDIIVIAGAYTARVLEYCARGSKNFFAAISSLASATFECKGPRCIGVPTPFHISSKRFHMHQMHFHHSPICCIRASIKTNLVSIHCVPLFKHTTYDMFFRHFLLFPYFLLYCLFPVPPVATHAVPFFPHSPSTSCANTGTTCRCSKSTSPDPRLCKRPLLSDECAVSLCDEPFVCDCHGQFTCQMATAVRYWECDQQGSQIFRHTDTCKCSNKVRATASYFLKLIGSFVEEGGCDMPPGFWA